MRPTARFVAVLLTLSPLAGADDAGRRDYTAARLDGAPPAIDGRLDDAAWAQAPVATDLVQRRPHPGAAATLRTEARILYDTDALYVGVRLLDPAPQSIVAPYPRRDDETTSDWVFVEIDSRHDRRTAFSFGLNPRGVQVDGVWFDDVLYDFAWNAVWEGAARIDGGGWSAEFRLPFSQITYSAQGTPEADGALEAVFGLNVYRYNPARGETSNWSPRLPSQAGIVSNFHDLHLRVPASRSRLELLPYLSAGDGFSGGVDLRARLGSFLTLTAAVNPDFGQVEADPSEVNLTTFETQLTERRALFVEDAGLFAFDLGLPLSTRGNSLALEQAFYSRRIGRLRGTAKLAGRTAGGWSVAGLAAVTEPRTAYGVTRVSRDFNRGRSAVAAIATGCQREDTVPAAGTPLPRRSFALGVNGRHRFASDTYEATAFALGARSEGRAEAMAAVLHGPGHYTQRPDALHLDAGRAGESASGFAAQARLARIGGDHWRWSFATHAVSPRLHLNDAGFQRNADWLAAVASLTYQHETPGRVWRRWSIGSSQIGAGWSFGGERRAAVFNLTASADLMSYYGGSVRWDHELPALQTEALRGGPALLMPSRDALALSLYSDTRRTTQATLDVSAFREAATDSGQVVVTPGVSLRPADRLAFSLGPSLAWTANAWQYVGAVPAAQGTRYVLGRLEQRTASLTLRADLAFTPRLTLQLYAQPFASRGSFGSFQEVAAPRAPRVEDRVRPLGPGAAGLPDPGYHVRDLRANLVLRWEYRPGSALFAVWTQQRHDSGSEPFLGPARELWGTFRAAPDNSFLLKVSYWLAPRKGR
jgi:uncharacterized protein DUF5916/cellulose/xylan binding protein with CBM9 domain